MKLHPEDMSSLLSHGLQSDSREDQNDVKQMQLDQSDNIDGEYKKSFFIYSLLFYS